MRFADYADEVRRRYRGEPELPAWTKDYLAAFDRYLRTGALVHRLSMVAILREHHVVDARPEPCHNDGDEK